MNHQTVRFALGRILIVIGLLMIPSIVVALIYGEGWAGVWPFLLSLACCVVPGWLLSAKKPTRTDFYMKEGFVVVALSWILLSLLGGLPMLFSGSLPSLADTFLKRPPDSRRPGRVWLERLNHGAIRSCFGGRSPI